MIFNKDKWKPKDIIFILEDDKPVFYACICISWGKGVKMFRHENMKLVDMLIGNIERQGLTWWQVKPNDNKTAYYLYYYPLIHLEHSRKKAKERQLSYEPDYSNSLKRIVKLFNWRMK